MEERVLGYGVIGTGVYCDHYFGTLGPVFKNLRPVGCSDLNVEAAKAAAARWNVPKVYTTEEMLADPEVDIVIILTNPASHYSLTMAALKAGKHVYCEKPLADSLQQANEIVEFAAEKGLFVGSAPDTFLTPEFQTVRKLLDEGAIGKVISVTANYVGPGADLWHPNAGYLYKKGVGPALDMGPYFLTSLVTLLGPIDSLFCYANRGWDVRKIWDKDVEVEVNTNYCAVLKFENGVIGNVVMAAGFIALFLWPTNNPYFLIGASFIGSLGFGAPAICYGMVGDSLEYGDWKLGKRQEGLAASLLSFGVKLATALCAPVVMLLFAVGYVPNQEQTEAAKHGINFMVNMLPAILAFVSCIPLIWYKLDDKRVAEIRSDLEAGKHAWDQ